MHLNKDLLIVSVIGGLAGILIQPLISTLLGATLANNFIFRFILLIGFLLLAPLALFVAYLLSKIWGTLYQFAKFAAVGTLNTLIDFGILNFLIIVSGSASGWAYSFFKAGSFLAATTNSFFWNKFWTFESKTKVNATEALSFYGIAAAAWAANVLIASIIVNGLARPLFISANLWANIGALAGVIGSFLINFLGYKYFVFKKTTD